MRDQLKWYDDKADNSAWLELAELRQRAAREGYCYQHVQAIIVAIDQYAEKALGNAITFSTSPMASGRCILWASNDEGLVALEASPVHAAGRPGLYQRPYRPRPDGGIFCAAPDCMVPSKLPARGNLRLIGGPRALRIAGVATAIPAPARRYWAVSDLSGLI
ncbi:hypothetical protein [Bradyrhizobium sp. sBnM-33]|uniref:hypothetical protein n=1 Tax=Bradyrhizobium sp. sBnM-33 TaxID=2831780 RepID=UPI0020C080BA|nr:hypothetical protein [Bradyrhizobium sp. sBnM-33]WOH53527.1 hypothetical protein RX328_16405 [Bradyrhizobium sp. sBnM-33]